MTGRPTKCTPATIARICEAVSLGCAYVHAAQAAGICVETFHDWKNRGAEGEEPFAGFLHALQKAEGEAVEANLRKLRAAANEGAWQAAAWILERRHPEEYGRPAQNLRLSNPDGSPLQITVVDG